MKHLSILLLLFTTACMKNNDIPYQPPPTPGLTSTQRPFNYLYIEGNADLPLYDSANRIYYCEMMNFNSPSVLQGAYQYYDTIPGPYSLQYTTDTLTITKLISHAPGSFEFTCMKNSIANSTMLQSYWNGHKTDYYNTTSDTLNVQFYYGNKDKDTLTPQQVVSGLNALLKKNNDNLIKEW
jgi:hypothetical protein